MFLYLLQEKVDSGFVYFLIDNFLNPTIQNIMCDFIKEKIGVSSEKNITINIQNVNIGQMICQWKIKALFERI